MSSRLGNHSYMNANANTNTNMRNHLNLNTAPHNRNRHHSSVVPTIMNGLQLAPNSIPPSPPFHSNTMAPFVPSLNMSAAPPRSPIISHDFEHLHTDPTLSSSPYLRSTKSAVDAALAIEINRIKSIETLEQKYTTMAEYKAALKKERRYSKNLVGELAALKSVAVTSTLEAEINEEGRINCLMRRLDVLQKEKGRIIVELEREEEMLTNTLQKKLNGVRREKEELERQIEKEHLIKARLESMQSNDNSMEH